MDQLGQILTLSGSSMSFIVKFGIIVDFLGISSPHPAFLFSQFPQKNIIQNENL